MPKHSPQPDPRSEVQKRILEVLRAAGGSCGRTELRNAVRGQTSLADFNEALNALAARGRITGELVTTWYSPRGTLIGRQSAVYSIAPKGNRKPSKLPIPPRAGRPRTNPVPQGQHLDERILTVLRDAGGSMDRHELHQAISVRLKAAQLDEAVARLITDGHITAKIVNRVRMAYAGYHGSRATVYTLVDGTRKRR